MTIARATGNRRRIAPCASAAVIAVMAISLAACGTKAATPAPSSSAGGQSNGSAAPAASPSTTASSSASATQIVRWNNLAQVAVPADWTLANAGQISFTPPVAAGKFVMHSHGFLGGTPGFPGTGTSQDVAHAGDAEYTGQKQTYGNAQRLPNIVINGVTLYHVSSRATSGWDDTYGTVYKGNLITVGWNIDKEDFTRPQAEELANSVMKTFKLL